MHEIIYSGQSLLITNLASSYQVKHLE